MNGPAQRRRRRVPGGKAHQHLVRVTPEEEAELVARARAAGVSVSRLLVESALGARPVNRTVVATELIGLRGQIRKIGGHSNQLAHAANAGQPVGAGDLADVLGELDALTDRWLDVIDEHLAAIRD